VGRPAFALSTRLNGALCHCWPDFVLVFLPDVRRFAAEISKSLKQTPTPHPGMAWRGEGPTLADGRRADRGSDTGRWPAAETEEGRTVVARAEHARWPIRK
jgi:hypothetical protein